MALSKKTKLILDQAMGGKKNADALVAAMAGDAKLSSKELQQLEIALCDKKAAANIAAAIDAASGSISESAYKALKNMMITKAAAEEMKTEIEG
jgi:hypothetical protein